MIVRRATLDDLPMALPLFEEFHKETESGFDITYHKDTIVRNIVWFISDQLAFSLLNDDGKLVGFIGGTIAPFLFDARLLCFIEAAWYVAPKYRRYGPKLLNEVEKYCFHHKIDKIIIGHTGMSSESKFRHFYERKGYSVYEVHYIKNLTGDQNASKSRQVNQEARAA